MKAKGKRQEAKGKRPEGAARHPYFCLLTFAFCLLPPVFLSSEPINSLHATAYVNDFAGVIDAASKQQLKPCASSSTARPPRKSPSSRSNLSTASRLRITPTRSIAPGESGAR